VGPAEINLRFLAWWRGGTCSNFSPFSAPAQSQIKDLPCNLGRPTRIFPAARNEQGFLIVPHEVAIGADCCGCLIVQVCGDQADITCYECGAVVRTVPVELASAVMVKMASAEICSTRCTHCGALNTFPGFSAIEASICPECGEGVAVSKSVQ
jgi:hypothetical protein